MTNRRSYSRFLGVSSFQYQIVLSTSMSWCLHFCVILSRRQENFLKPVTSVQRLSIIEEAVVGELDYSSQDRVDARQKDSFSSHCIYHLHITRLSRFPVTAFTTYTLPGPRYSSSHAAQSSISEPRTAKPLDV